MSTARYAAGVNLMDLEWADVAVGSSKPLRSLAHPDAIDSYGEGADALDRIQLDIERHPVTARRVSDEEDEQMSQVRTCVE